NCDFARQWRLVFDRQLDSAFTLMRVPHSVVESKLHLLFHVAWKVVRSHPARMNVECRLPMVVVAVDQPELGRIPRIPIRRSDDATLASAHHTLQATAKCKVD